MHDTSIQCLWLKNIYIVCVSGCHLSCSTTYLKKLQRWIIVIIRLMYNILKHRVNDKVHKFMLNLILNFYFLNIVSTKQKIDNYVYKCMIYLFNVFGLKNIIQYVLLVIIHFVVIPMLIIYRDGKL